MNYMNVMKQPRIFYLLQRAHSALFRACDSALRKSLSLTATQQATLFLLVKNDGLTISEIANTLRMGKSSLTGLIDRMVARGLVRRAPNALDGRSFEIFIEPTGADIARASLADVKRLNVALLGPFSVEECEVIERFLNHVSANANTIVQNNIKPQNKERISA